jgi:hypothetical protein
MRASLLLLVIERVLFLIKLIKFKKAFKAYLNFGLVLDKVKMPQFLLMLTYSGIIQLVKQMIKFRTIQLLQLIAVHRLQMVGIWFLLIVLTRLKTR